MELWANVFLKGREVEAEGWGYNSQREKMYENIWQNVISKVWMCSLCHFNIHPPTNRILLSIHSSPNIGIFLVSFACVKVKVWLRCLRILFFVSKTQHSLILKNKNKKSLFSPCTCIKKSSDDFLIFSFVIYFLLKRGYLFLIY